MADRASFEATAKYWAETFAGASPPKPAPPTTTQKTVDLLSMYGLSKETVDRYVHMGFDREKVIDKMRKLNIRSLTLEESEGEKGARLLEELF